MELERTEEGLNAPIFKGIILRSQVYVLLKERYVPFPCLLISKSYLTTWVSAYGRRDGQGRVGGRVLKKEDFVRYYPMKLSLDQMMLSIPDSDRQQFLARAASHASPISLSHCTWVFFLSISVYLFISLSLAIAHVLVLIDGTHVQDFQPYMASCPYTIWEMTRLPRVFNLFRTMGLRHLIVLKRYAQHKVQN